MTAAVPIDDLCSRALRKREAWVARGSVAIASIVEPVSVGDDLRLRVDESHEGIGDLRDGQGEGRETSGTLSELALRDAGGVPCLQGMALSVHQEIDLGHSVLGRGHGAEPTDGCPWCATANSVRVSWVTERAS